MSSKYASDLPLLVKDIHNLLITELALPTPFSGADPHPGEAYGLLSSQNITDWGTNMLALDCQFLASSAFTSYWDAATWSISTGANLDNLMPQVKTKVGGRGILGDFVKRGNISIGRPRAPLKAVAGQNSTVWIVDVLMPCQVQTMIARDVMCGHL